MYQRLIKPILFSVDPEKAHHLVTSLLKTLFKLPGAGFLVRKSFEVNHPSLHKKVFGIEFKNPVGLAAGFDKDARIFKELSALGFGFIEIGTVTPKAQPGNEKPRLFRLPADQALINRMGFNNEGARAAAQRLRKKKNIIIGGNIGKNKLTSNEAATSDYLSCFTELYPYVDYFVVNVSSPNTPNLRDLQEKEPLQALLNELQILNRSQVAYKPLLLKIAPDLSDAQLDDIIEIVKNTGIDGVIATNTTISRENLVTDKEIVGKIGAGGLSGKILSKRSTAVIRYLHTKSNGSFPIIGVGGIHTPEDAWEKIEAGASLVQLYTGFIYEGPALIGRINRFLIKKLQDKAKKP